MKSLGIRLLALWITVIIGSGLARSQTTGEMLPNGFGDAAFKHIEFLSALGHRQVGSGNDLKTIQYVYGQFTSIGLHVEIQPFQFRSFEYGDTEFMVNDRKLAVYALGLPHAPRTMYAGEAVLIDGKKFDASRTRDLAGKCIITNDWSAHFRLLPALPELIVYLDPSEFEKIEKKARVDFTLRISGRTETFASANVIARLGHPAPSKKEVLVTAHFDTYRRNNPGASDNASGIGVLIELARYFKRTGGEPPCVIKFVAFGGEEIGIMGSRNYMHTNRQDLAHCELLFNIDDVGGHGKIMVERNGGVKGVSRIKGLSQIPDHMKDSSWEGVSSMWRMLPAGDDLLKVFSASNHPDWLVDMVERSINELGYEVVYTGTQGSDQLAFAQAGIVTSGVGIIGDYQHSPEDKPEHIHKDSLRKAGEIALRMVTNTVKRIAGDAK